MRRRARGIVHRPPRLPTWTAVVLLLVFLAPYGAGLLSSARAEVPAAEPQLLGVSGTVFWNGVNVDTAPTPASAISWSFSNVAHVQYDWTGPVLGPGVSQAFLVILFLGLPAYTKQEVRQSALPIGSVNMTYDLTQYKYVLQGLFQLHAYLEDPNGTTVWSENFYVRVSQPYDLVAVTVGLILLTVAELYMVATVGPRAADKLRQAPPAAERPPEGS